MPQVAALPYRIGDDGQVEVLLITTRRTKRYIHSQRMADERAKRRRGSCTGSQGRSGIIGMVSKDPIGQYFYWKELSRMSIKIRVSVFALGALMMIASIFR